MHGRNSAYDGMMMFRVPSRQSLGWGGQHDSPPVYALIHHRKARPPPPVRQTWRARARTLLTDGPTGRTCLLMIVNTPVRQK